MDESWDNLSSIWSSTEEILYIISNARGETPRDGVLLYAKPYSGQLEKLLASGSINLEDEESLGIFLKKTQLQSRFFSINFDNIGKEKNTIEIRLPNGTVDAETWIQNINLFGGIVKAAEYLARIQIKSKNERTESETNMLESFNRLTNKETSQLDKLEELLFLTIAEENRDIYRKRYGINSILIERKQKMQKHISKSISGNTVSLTNVRRKSICMLENR